MVERILEIFKLKNLSPSQFADEIGVQRSNISHLISGRNKPSLEFIQKIMNRFPDVNPEYILSGHGNILRDGLQTSLDLSSLSVKMPEIQFEGQTKAKLGSMEAQGATSSVFAETFSALSSSSLILPLPLRSRLKILVSILFSETIEPEPEMVRPSI